MMTNPVGSNSPLKGAVVKEVSYMEDWKKNVLNSIHLFIVLFKDDTARGLTCFHLWNFQEMTSKME